MGPMPCRLLNSPKTNTNMTITEPIYDYEQRLARYRHNIAQFPSGETALQFVCLACLMAWRCESATGLAVGTVSQR
ncbi:MAG: hypothetical protein LBQ98_03720 [Nitrososphaerota archaeon]|nr:hypothetical protein [Nitrososphaerota archaeon]